MEVGLVRKWITASLLTGCLIYILSPGVSHFIANPGSWELREQLVFLTGACATSFMVLSILISIRFEPINSILKGLDKAYVVHKWAGIWTTIFVLFHWLLEKIPHLLVELGVIPNPGELSDGSRFPEWQITLFQIGVTLVGILVYVFILLVSIALLKKIPYRLFRVTHKMFPVIFLLIAFHAAIAQLKEHWLSSTAGYLLLLLLGIGSIAALIGLFQQIGSSRKAEAIIKKIKHHENGILDIYVEMFKKPFVHQAGQYAFLQFPYSKEPHPFTIASSTNESGKLRFVIKELGDFTNDLRGNIKTGQQLTVEGPYGEFKFEDDCERQIWIAGGIGITPFMARLEYLSKHPEVKKQVDFWYATRGELDNQFPKSIQELCERCGVNFYHLNSTKNEYLTIDSIKHKVGDFENLSIWFCGPQGFLKYLQQELKPYKFDKTRFHYDNFSMR